MKTWKYHISFVCSRIYRNTGITLSINSAAKTSSLQLRPRPHVSGCFLIRNFFFPDTAIICPQAHGELASKSGNFWIRSPEWKFNPITFRVRVDGRSRIFSDTMSSQNWRQYLPRKFRHGRRSEENSFCAPWAYFQSFSWYAAKCRSSKCWNKLC